MSAKIWGAKEIRTLAQQTVDGRKTITNARGQYLRALIETAQVELKGETDHTVQRRTLAAVQKRFVAIVREAIATDEILLADGCGRKEIADVRNRRLNFTRTNYGAIRSWLRAPGHDLLKLDASKVTKGKLEQEGAPSTKHMMTEERIAKHADKYIGGLLTFVKQLDKDDQAQVLTDAVEMLLRKLDIKIADLRVRGKPFLKLVA